MGNPKPSRRERDLKITTAIAQAVIAERDLKLHGDGDQGLKLCDMSTRTYYPSEAGDSQPWHLTHQVDGLYEYVLRLLRDKKPELVARIARTGHSSSTVWVRLLDNPFPPPTSIAAVAGHSMIELASKWGPDRMIRQIAGYVVIARMWDLLCEQWHTAYEADRREIAAH